MGGRGLSFGKSSGGGAATGGNNGLYSSIDGRILRETVAKSTGLSGKSLDEYIYNENKAIKMERELNKEMSSSTSKHSVNWRRETQREIESLRDKNQKLRYG